MAGPALVDFLDFGVTSFRIDEVALFKMVLKPVLALFDSDSDLLSG